LPVQATAKKTAGNGGFLAGVTNGE